VPFSPPRKQRADDLRNRLDILEAERLVLTIELRNALIRAAKRPAASRDRAGERHARRRGQ